MSFIVPANYELKSTCGSCASWYLKPASITVPIAHKFYSTCSTCASQYPQPTSFIVLAANWLHDASSPQASQYLQPSGQQNPNPILLAIILRNWSYLAGVACMILTAIFELYCSSGFMMIISGHCNIWPPCLLSVIITNKASIWTVVVLLMMAAFAGECHNDIYIG